jgi:PAS domain S-box-containing protein
VDGSERLILRLQETLGKMELALGSIQEAIVWTDRDGLIQWCNRGFDLLVEKPHILNLGKNINDLLAIELDGTSVPAKKHPIQILQTKGTLEKSIYQLSREDGLISLEVSGSSEMLGGKENVFIFTFRDITELLMNQQALSRAKKDLERKVLERTDQLLEISERYSNILTEAVDAIITINEKGIIQSFNPAAEQIFGYRVKEVVGKNVTLIMPLPFKDEHDGYIEHYLKSGEKRIIGIGREVTGVHRDGSQIPLYLAVSEVRHRGKKFFTGILRNISEQKKAEQALLAAKNEAEKANRAKSAFLANMSHEIRTPMNAVLGFSDLLTSLVTDPEQLRYLDTIRSAGKGLLTIINDILDLSKIEAGKLNLHYEPVNLRTLLAEVRQIFIPSLVAKEVQLLVEVEDVVPKNLMLDEVRLRQILINLLGNGVKFTSKGYVKLSATLTTGDREDEVGLQITVEDTGPGIDAAQRQFIFEAFSQQSTDYRASIKGTGLGLTITRRLVEIMNGEVSVESEVGKGSSFTLNLHNVEVPASNVAVRSAETNTKVDAVIFKPAKILVVDDVASNRDLIKGILSRSGLEIIEAEDGEQGLACIRREHPNVVLLDIRMPGIDGFEVLRQVKQDQDIAEVILIAVTASVVETEKTRLDFSGFDAIVFKPVTYDSLVTVLSRFIQSETISSLTDEGRREFDGENQRIPRDLERLLTELELIGDRVQLFTGAIELEAIEELAGLLLQLGQLHNSALVQGYAEKLQQAVDRFSISRIKELLEDYTALCRNIRQSLG